MYVIKLSSFTYYKTNIIMNPGEQNPAPLQQGSSPQTNDATSVPSERFELPQFIKQNVRLWFTQIEQKLTVHRIATEKAKFANVTSSLPPEIAAQVSDLLFNLPATNSYTILKARIIQEYEDSATLKTNKLLEECELGDQKPTALLRKMKQLADSRVNDEFLLNLFLQRLPENVRMVLTTTGVTDLDKAAGICPTQLQGLRRSHHAFSSKHGRNINRNPAANSGAHRSNEQTRHCQCSCSRSSIVWKKRSRSRYYTPDHHRRSSSRTRHELCWYHFSTVHQRTNVASLLFQRWIYIGK